MSPVVDTPQNGKHSKVTGPVIGMTFQEVCVQGYCYVLFLCLDTYLHEFLHVKDICSSGLLSNF